jgi:anti-sigma regulatory factor (Ser/Thr protein kinase)
MGVVIASTFPEEVVTVIAPFPSDPSSVTDARHFVADALTEDGCPRATIETAELLVSELASNAVLHARSPFQISLSRYDHSVTIAVTDGSDARPVRREVTETGGRGLHLVAALAKEWGVCSRNGGKAVYFRLPC